MLLRGIIGLLFFKLGSSLAVKERPNLRNGLSSLIVRMQYWQPAGPALPPTSRYLIFTNDQGGPNNLRIGWEMTGVVAQRTNRTLVLPPAQKIYLLDYGPLNGRDSLKTSSFDGSSETKVEDLINLEQLKANLPTLTWDEFHEKTGLSFMEAKAKAEQVRGTGCRAFHEFQEVQSDILYMDGQGLRQGFSCGDWAKQGGPVSNWRGKMTDKNWALLTHGFVWHPDAFSIASKVVNFLGIFQYNALHGRYGDLQYQDVKTRPENIFHNWPSLLEGVKTLYIASDNPEKFDSLDVGKVRALKWEDLFTEKTGNLLESEKAKYTPERWFKLMGPVEELICTYSKLFVGTRLSSFSGHIERMRIHSKAPVQEVHVHDTPENPGEIQKILSVWDERESRYQRHDRSSGDVFLEFTPWEAF
jgi:hypothetical protein